MSRWEGSTLPHPFEFKRFKDKLLEARLFQYWDAFNSLDLLIDSGKRKLATLTLIAFEGCDPYISARGHFYRRSQRWMGDSLAPWDSCSHLDHKTLIGPASLMIRRLILKA